MTHRVCIFTSEFFYRFASSFRQCRSRWFRLWQWYSTKWHVAIRVLTTHTNTLLPIIVCKWSIL